MEVFPLSNTFGSLDSNLNQVAIYVLVLMFLISIGFYALNRFEGFNPESRVNQFIIFGVFIGLWPQVMTGMKELVDSFNGFLLKDVFHIQWQGFETIGSVIWERVRIENGYVDLFFNGLSKCLAYALDVARLLLYYLFAFWFFFYKTLGPFVIARGILADDFSVLKDLLGEVSILLLWQTTFVLLLGFFSLSMKGAF